MRGLQHYISLHAFIIIEHDPIISVEWKALRHIGQTSENTINLIVYAWLSGQLIELCNSFSSPGPDICHRMGKRNVLAEIFDTFSRTPYYYTTTI